MLPMIFKMVSIDPLDRMLVTTPLAILREGAEDGVDVAANEMLGTAIVNAPWFEGTLTNAHEIRKPRSVSAHHQRNGVLAYRTIAVSRSRFPDRYYAVPVHFGSQHIDEPDNWLHRSRDESEPEVYAAIRDGLRKRIARGK